MMAAPRVTYVDANFFTLCNQLINYIPPIYYLKFDDFMAWVLAFWVSFLVRSYNFLFVSDVKLEFLEDQIVKRIITLL